MRRMCTAGGHYSADVKNARAGSVHISASSSSCAGAQASFRTVPCCLKRRRQGMLTTKPSCASARCAGRLPMPTTNGNWHCMRRPRLLFEILVPVWNQNSAFARLLRLSLLLHNQKLRPRRWRGNRRRRSSTKSRLDDMRIQNNMLHDQMASLSTTVDKFQSTKASALMGKELSRYFAEYNAGVADAVGKKQLSDLCELLRFKTIRMRYA